MALSLESIYAPLKDFFLNQFSVSGSSPIFFRFSKFGSVLGDQDFIDPAHPELGYMPALATEKFSDLVNHIPVDAGDGVNIILSENSIDETYFLRLLTPATPCFPAGADDNTKQAIIDSFSSIKAEALKIWNDLKLESSTGLMLQYKPSLATPENWYDKSKNESWTSHSFSVSESTAAPPPGPPTPIWRMKLSEEQFRNISQLPEPTVAAPQPPVNLSARILQVRASPRVMMAPAGAMRVAQPVRTFATPMTRNFAMTERITPIAATTAPVAESINLQATYVKQYHEMDISKRLMVTQFVAANAPTQPVRTSSFSISFDYCVVNIRRPWYVDAFMDASSWCIPSLKKGDVTGSGPAGNLSLMPIGFVAVRNLNIEASWAAEDITISSQATDFGPFKISTEIVNNKLSHPGLQVVGWMLQKMPDLPPNDAG